MRKSFKKVPKFLLVICVLLLSSMAVWAQNVITGRVTDSKDGSPVAGVTVTVKGTKASTQTGADGTFSLTAPAGSKTLVFSSVGFTPTEASIGNGGAVNISLTQMNTQLNDVVVVAYGTRRKGDLTGAVTSVTAKDFQKGDITSAEQLLVGKVAGLSVITGGGSAGGGSTIRIRGGASLNASNDPLIVIDGVPVESNGLPGSANLLNTINPNDIESISVLKDASATALYGSRASNGVIIVTTKKGRRGKLLFNFNTQLSVGMVTKKVDVLSGDQIRSIITADAAASGNNNYKALLGTSNTDWQKQIYQAAIGNDNNLSASGSLGGTSFDLPFRASLGYTNQAGILKTNHFDRISTALNLSPKLLGDHLSVNINFKYSHTTNRFANEGAVSAAASFDPTQPINANNKYGGYFEWLQGGNGLPIGTNGGSSQPNPLSLLNYRHNTSQVNRIIGNVQLDYKLPFFPDLHLQTNLGLDNGAGKGDDHTDSILVTDYQTGGRYSHYEQKRKNYLADVSLYYVKEIKSIKSKIDVLAGHSYQDFFIEVTNFASYSQAGNLIPNTTPTFVNDKPEYRLESYLGRMNFTYNDRYLLTGSIRRDASSKFSKSTRVGYFPAAAAAWKLKEDFFNNSSQISELKLRFGWGITGQQDFNSYYAYLPYYSQSNSGASYQFGNTFYSFLRPSAYDANIKWETTTTTNLGLDFGFLRSRITGSVEVYKKKTKDLLSVIPVAPGSNFDITLLTNVGNLENKGVELSINTVPVKTNKLTWEFGFNVTYNETKITNLLKQPDPNFKGIDVSGISGGTGNNIGKFTVGYAPYSYFVFKQAYDQNGKPIEGLYDDQNRDGKIDDADRYLYKKPAPDYLVGFSTSVTKDQWSFGITGHGMIGNYLYNNYNSNHGVLRALKDPQLFISNGSSNYIETNFSNNQYLSDYYIQNASFLRIDNINLGYNMGKVWRNKATLRLLASVQNVFIITKYKGLDPENSGSSGIDNNIYPRPRVYSLGANLDF